MKRTLIITALIAAVLGAGAGGTVYFVGWDKVEKTYYWGHDRVEKTVGDDEPKAIAERFWQATLGGRTETASWYMKSQEGLQPTMTAANSDDHVILGAVAQQEGYYFVDTTLVLHRPAGRRFVRLKTVLVPNPKGDWLVDFWSSQQTAFDVSLDDGLARMSALLRNAVEEFPFLLGSVTSVEEEKQAASEQLDYAFAQAKEKLLVMYEKQLETMNP